MKKQRSLYRLFIFAAGFAPLVTGCVTDQDFRVLELQVRSMDNRVVELEKEVEEFRAGDRKRTTRGTPLRLVSPVTHGAPRSQDDF